MKKQLNRTNNKEDIKKIMYFIDSKKLKSGDKDE